MSVKHYLNSLARVALVGGVTPVQHLQRLSEYLQRDISIKRDDISHPGMGGNKLRKLEFLAAVGSEVRSAAGESHSNRGA